MARYVVLLDENRKPFAAARSDHAAIVEYDERDRGPFYRFYRNAQAESDAVTLYRNADRLLYVDALDAVPFNEAVPR